MSKFFKYDNVVISKKCIHWYQAHMHELYGAPIPTQHASEYIVWASALVDQPTGCIIGFGSEKDSYRVMFKNAYGAGDSIFDAESLIALNPVVESKPKKKRKKSKRAGK